MNWEAIGAVGEVLGGVAVIVTLIYLAVQTQQVRRAAAAHAPEWASDGYRATLVSLRQDAELTRLHRRSLHDWHGLSANEQARVHYFHAEMILHLDAILSLRQQRLLDEERARAWVDNALGLLVTPGGKDWWSATKVFWSPQARTELETRLADTATLPPAWTTIPLYRLDEADHEKIAADQGVT